MNSCPECFGPCLPHCNINNGFPIEYIVLSLIIGIFIGSFIIQPTKYNNKKKIINNN